MLLTAIELTQNFNRICQIQYIRDLSTYFNHKFCCSTLPAPMMDVCRIFVLRDFLH